MKLTFDGTDVYIGDNDPEAVKIKKGHSWSLVNGKIVIGAKTGYDLSAFQAKLKTNSATIKEVNEFIREYILK